MKIQPVSPGKHVVADFQELHDPLIQMQIFQTFEQVRVPETNLQTNLS